MLIPRFLHPGLRAIAVGCALAASGLCLPLLATAEVTQVDGLDIPTVKISPLARITPLDEAPLSDKAVKLLQAMVRHPLVLSDAQVHESARIIAGADKRVMFGAGDQVYAISAEYPGQALPVRGQRLRIFRELRPLKDPQTSEVLGYEAHIVGNASWVQNGGPALDTVNPEVSTMRVAATLDIVASEQEIMVGDHVLMTQIAPPDPIRPRLPSQVIQARVMGLYGTGQLEASQNQIVSINQGRSHGVEVGHVLNILSRPATARDKADPLKESWQMPQKRTGTALVFLSYERMAYALLTEVQEGVRVGDALAGP
jgi:hypothetical protein